MIILVDIGNTSTKIATAEGGKILSVTRITTDETRTPDELYVYLKTLGMSEPRDAVVCSVVPSLTPKFVSMFRQRMNLGHPLVVSPYIVTGIELNYKTLSNLGPDRIANAVAAYYEYGKDVAVVDFGTATTIDFVTSDGKYLGGIIAPGLDESLHHLVSSTSRLPEIELAKPTRYIGRSTEECMQSGFYLLTIGFIEASRTAVRKETKIDFTFVATGGLAERFAPLSSAIGIIDRDLTLKGCWHLYRLNKLEEKG